MEKLFEHYANGYWLRLIDHGFRDGIKLEFEGERELCGMILSPEKVKEIAGFLTKSLGQEIPQLPNDLDKVMRRIANSEDLKILVKSNERRILREALKVLKDFGRIDLTVQSY